MVTSSISASGDGQATSDGWVRRHDAALTVIGAVVMSRVLVVLGVVLAGASTSSVIARRWDGKHYLVIAAHGYPSVLFPPGQKFSNWAFFPAYPLLVRFVSALTGLSVARAALGVNIVLCGVLAYVLWRLFDRISGRAVATRASVLFWFLPGTVVLVMAYSEALFLVFVSVALLALLDERWWTAGLAGALATATRPSGLAVVVACAVSAAIAIRRDRNWHALAAPVVACAGIVAFIGYGVIRTRDALFWQHSEAAWHQTIDFGARLPHTIAASLAHHDHRSWRGALLILGIVMVLGAVVMLVRDRGRLPACLLAYSAAMALIEFSSSAVGPKPRFLIVFLPVIVVVARQLGRASFAVLVTGLALLLPWVSWAYFAPSNLVP